MFYSKTETERKVLETLLYLQDVNSLMWSLVRGLPLPQETNVTEIAAVYWDKKEDRKHLIINPDGFNKLEVEDRAFVLCHEFLHLFFNHVGEEYDRAVYSSSKRVELAREVQINDTLDERLGFSYLTGCVNGPDMGIGAQPDKPWQEIYLLLPEDDDNHDNGDNGNGDGEGDGNGDCVCTGDGEAPQVGGADTEVLQSDADDEAGNEPAPSMEDFVNEAKAREKEDKASQEAGRGGGRGVYRRVQSDLHRSLEFLLNRLEKLEQKENWRLNPRTLTGMSDKFRMPIRYQDDPKRIALCFDVSGSVRPSYVAAFIEAYQALNEKQKDRIDLYVWASRAKQVTDFTRFEDDICSVGVGTDYSSLVDEIKPRLAAYPDVVIVTDGQFTDADYGREVFHGKQKLIPYSESDMKTCQAAGPVIGVLCF